jgi:hypothetical protein
MSLNSVYRLSVVGSVIDQTIVNTFHFRQTVATLPDGETAPNAILRRWTTGTGSPLSQYLALLPVAYTIRELIVLNVADPLDNGSRQVTGTGIRSAGDILPPQCCALLSIRTLGRGRSFRGRTYIGPLGESDQQQGSIGTGLQSALTAFVNSVFASYGGISGLEWTVYSRRLSTSNDVTQVIIRNFVATQRRRSRYAPG